MNVLKELLVVLRCAQTLREVTPALVEMASCLKVIIMDAGVKKIVVCQLYWHFSQLTFMCIDIDECRSNTDGCSQVCTNTEGSYICSCNSGYRLNEDRHTCNGS